MERANSGRRLLQHVKTRAQVAPKSTNVVSQWWLTANWRLLWRPATSPTCAILPSIPTDVTAFAVEHPQWALPIVKDTGGWGRKSREAKVRLLPGQTNQIAVRLEPHSQSSISDY